MHDRVDIEEGAHVPVPVQELDDGEERLPVIIVRYRLSVRFIIGCDLEESPLFPDTRDMPVPDDASAIARLEP